MSPSSPSRSAMKSATSPPITPRRANPYARRSSVLGVLGAILGSVVGGGHRQRGRADVAIARAARDAELLARAGISGRHARHPLHDRLPATIPPAAPACWPRSAAPRALEARVQGRDNRQTPEWASTHPLSENRVQRALAERARDRPARHRACATATSSWRSSRASIVDDDPAQGVIEGRTFTHPDLRIFFAVPQGYLMQNGTTRRVDQRIGREGAVQRRPLQRQPRELHLPGAPGSLTGGQVRLAIAAGAADDDQRHSRRLHDGPREHLVRVGRRQRVRLSMGSEHASTIS